MGSITLRARSESNDPRILTDRGATPKHLAPDIGLGDNDPE